MHSGNALGSAKGLGPRLAGRWNERCRTMMIAEQEIVLGMFRK